VPVDCTEKTQESLHTIFTTTAKCSKDDIHLNLFDSE